MADIQPTIKRIVANTGLVRHVYDLPSTALSTTDRHSLKAFPSDSMIQAVRIQIANSVVVDIALFNTATGVANTIGEIVRITGITDSYAEVNLNTPCDSDDSLGEAHIDITNTDGAAATGLIRFEILTGR